jgi:hypothetical protein
MTTNFFAILKYETVNAYQPNAETEAQVSSHKTNEVVANPPQKLNVSALNSSVHVNQITFAGKAMPHVELVEIKHVNIGTIAYKINKQRRVRALGHWFGRTNQLCVGKARGDGLVRVEMEDVSNTMAKMHRDISSNSNEYMAFSKWS